MKSATRNIKVREAETPATWREISRINVRGEAMSLPQTHPLFLLDEKGEVYPVYDVEEWAKEYPDQRLLARDEIPLLDQTMINPVSGRPFRVPTSFVVETVFLGMVSVYDQIGRMQFYSPPCYFETVVWGADGKGYDGDKYQEHGDENKMGSAKRGHKIKVEIWRKALGVDPA